MSRINTLQLYLNILIVLILYSCSVEYPFVHLVHNLDSDWPIPASRRTCFIFFNLVFELISTSILFLSPPSHLSFSSLPSPSERKAGLFTRGVVWLVARSGCSAPFYSYLTGTCVRLSFHPIRFLELTSPPLSVTVPVTIRHRANPAPTIPILTLRPTPTLLLPRTLVPQVPIACTATDASADYIRPAKLLQSSAEAYESHARRYHRQLEQFGNDEDHKS